MSAKNARHPLLVTLCAVLIVGAILTTAGCGKTYSREDFTSMVKGKSEVEIKKALGEPDWVNDTDPIMWTYRHTTFDAGNQNARDAQAVIIFEHGGTAGARKAVEVRFDSTS